MCLVLDVAQQMENVQMEAQGIVLFVANLLLTACVLVCQLRRWRIKKGMDAESNYGNYQ